ncbi:alpha/beta hydrolase [Natronomonas sp. EA1]|uniref:alpha/beta hydrolase n=1 Tax=Natronomonas sp. EA1 TaxID=3421655 RepID=UPI003EC0D5A6
MIDPHADQPIRTAGAPRGTATAACILLHGRGDSPEGILRLVDELAVRGVTYLAPAAAGRVWYPGAMDDPDTERRAAFLDSAFGRIDAAVAMASDLGISLENVVLAGFSQGAAVVCEYALANPRAYGGLVGLAGGLLGPVDALDARGGDGDALAGTPVSLAVGDDDPHVSPARIEATGRVFEQLGGEVETHVEAGLGHAISDAELQAFRGSLDRVA